MCVSNNSIILVTWDNSWNGFMYSKYNIDMLDQINNNIQNN